MPFADELLGPDDAHLLVQVLGRTSPARAFPALAAAAGALGGLALGARAERLRLALDADVPESYGALADVVRRAADDDELRGWAVWPVTAAVAMRAVEDGSPEAFDDALDVLAALTGRMTSEFSIRHLLRHDVDRVLEAALGWTSSADPAVRRLASEGTRRFLPWGLRVPALAARPEATLPILAALFRDDDEVVRRSVANHLNDLSRDEAGLVVATAARWLVDPAPTTPVLVRHALRTLVKRGDPAALALLGFRPAEVEVDGPFLDRSRVVLGEAVTLTATLRNVGVEPARLVVDHVVHHVKADGSRTPKTFKLTTLTLAPGERAEVRKVHAFREITTRRYHSGVHGIALQVNGVATRMVDVELVVPGDGS